MLKRWQADLRVVQRGDPARYSDVPAQLSVRKLLVNDVSAALGHASQLSPL